MPISFFVSPTDKEHLSAFWFSGALHWLTQPINIAHCSYLEKKKEKRKKALPTHKCAPMKKSTHLFPAPT